MSPPPEKGALKRLLLVDLHSLGELALGVGELACLADGGPVDGLLVGLVLADGDLREGNVDVVLVEDYLPLAVHGPLDDEEVLLLTVGHEQEVHAGLAEAVHALVEGAGDDLGDVLLDPVDVVPDDQFDAGEVVPVLHSDVAEGDGGLLGLVDDGGDLRVVDDLDVAAVVDQLGGPHTDLGDGSPPSVDDDDVADLEVVLEHHEQTGDDVGDQALGSETDDQGEDTGGCDEGRGVDSPGAVSEEDCDDVDQILHQALDELHGGDDLFASLGEVLEDDLHHEVDQPCAEHYHDGLDDRGYVADGRVEGGVAEVVLIEYGIRSVYLIAEDPSEHREHRQSDDYDALGAHEVLFGQCSCHF